MTKKTFDKLFASDKNNWYGLSNALREMAYMAFKNVQHTGGAITDHQYNMWDMPDKFKDEAFRQEMFKRDTKPAKQAIELNRKAIAAYEPFTGLQIKACKLTADGLIWVEDRSADFFGVYGLAQGDSLYYQIADCDTRENATNLCESFRIISRYSLTLNL